MEETGTRTIDFFLVLFYSLSLNESINIHTSDRVSLLGTDHTNVLVTLGYGIINEMFRGFGLLV